MTPEQLRQRTLQFGLRAMKLAEALPRGRAADAIARQIVRCGTSVGANYRAACRSRSNSEFISNIHVVEEEADETAYWLELLGKSELVKKEALEPLLKEANELTAIAVASGNTARGKRWQGRRPTSPPSEP